MLENLLLSVCVCTTFAALAAAMPQRSRWAWARLLVAALAALALALYGTASLTVGALDLGAPQLGLVPVALAAALGGPLASLIVAAPVAALLAWQGATGAWPALLGLALVALSVAGAKLTRGKVAHAPLWLPAAGLALADAAWLLLAGAPRLSAVLVPEVLVPELLALLGAQLAAFALGLSVLRERFATPLPELAAPDFMDPLTGLYNRRQFDEDIAELPEGHPAFLLVLDLDDFRRVNDEHGHAFGDKVLAACANLVRQSVRMTDGVYRYGGEEFAVMLHGCTPEAARMVSERVRASIERNLGRAAGRSDLRLTASAGLVELHRESVKNELVEVATLLHAAKTGGRNRVVAQA